MKMMSRPTIDEAEAIFLISLSKLTWLIPLLVVFNTIMKFFAAESNILGFDLMQIDIASLFATFLLYVIIIKIINVVDKQLNDERKLRSSKRID